MKILPREFYDRDAVTVAQELLGKYLVVKDKRKVITGTEPYLGKEDPASHNEQLFYGRGGIVYVF